METTELGHYLMPLQSLEKSGYYVV